MPSVTNCKTEIFRLSEFPNLETVWRDLESRSDAGFMLTWSWIGTWVNIQLGDLNPFLLVTKSEGKIVGLTILIVNRTDISRFLRIKCLHVHTTGDENRDAICIEYNNVLSEAGFERSVARSVISFLAENKDLPEALSGWQSINIDMIAGTGLEAFTDQNLLPWHTAETASFGVDLAEIRRSGKNYIVQLSKNTRYQIRRSLRLYEARGNLEVLVAQSPDEALAYYQEAGEYHKLRWSNDNQKSIFSEAQFNTFHQRLIQTCFARKEVELIKITVAGEPIGFLYNFIFNGVVYFYQCAFDYENDNRLKPGLVSHYLCINKYIEEGLRYYDFMAGENQYKSSLGNKSEVLYSVHLCRNNFKFQALNILRAVKNRLT